MPAAATCEVSCTAEPRNTPAANESPPNSVCATNGYVNIASRPNAVMHATA